MTQISHTQEVSRFLSQAALGPTGTHRCRRTDFRGADSIPPFKLRGIRRLAHWVAVVRKTWTPVVTLARVETSSMRSMIQASSNHTSPIIILCWIHNRPFSTRIELHKDNSFLAPEASAYKTLYQLAKIHLNIMISFTLNATQEPVSRGVIKTRLLPSLTSVAKVALNPSSSTSKLKPSKSTDTKKAEMDPKI